MYTYISSPEESEYLSTIASYQQQIRQLKQALKESEEAYKSIVKLFEEIKAERTLSLDDGK